jgi:hypothetical protein
MRNERQRNESRKKDGMKRGEKGQKGEGGGERAGCVNDGLLTSSFDAFVSFRSKRGWAAVVRLRDPLLWNALRKGKKNRPDMASDLLVLTDSQHVVLLWRR